MCFMGEYTIQSGDTLSKIAQRFKVSVKQLQEANGIKNANLIFAGSTLKLPSVESEEGFKVPGLTVESNPENAQASPSTVDNNAEVPVDMAAETPVNGSDEAVETPKQPVRNNNIPAEVKQEKTETPQNTAPEVKAEKAENLQAAQTTNEPPAAENAENTFQIAANLKSPVQLSNALTLEEVAEELFEKAQGKRIPALPGEIEEGNWSEYINKNSGTSENPKPLEMVCRDDSGKTQDIRGTFRGIDSWSKNPDAFTITDSSSGSDHEYLYRKIGLNDKGQPVYKCISMNGNPIETDNQYTMEWNDGVPELVQHSDQDNHSIGLRVGDKKPEIYDTQGKEIYDTQIPERYKVGPGDYTKENETYQPSVGDDSAAPQTPKKDEVTIYLNQQPRRNGIQPTFGKMKQGVIDQCEKQRPLSKTEQEQLNACKNMQEVREYLKTLGIKVGYAF